MMGFDYEPKKKIEIRINLKALMTTLWVITFAVVICGVFGAWR